MGHLLNACNTVIAKKGAKWPLKAPDSAVQICVFKVPGGVQDILYLTAVLNSCINPLIYGAYYYCDTTNTRNNISIRY